MREQDGAVVRAQGRHLKDVKLITLNSLSTAGVKELFHS